MNNLVGLNTRKDKLAYCLAKVEAEHSGYPKSWHGMMICSSIEFLHKTMSEKEMEEYFIAIFGKEALEELIK